LQWRRCSRRRCSVRLIFAFLACHLRQELEQDSDHDKQKEKEIVEMHLWDS